MQLFRHRLCGHCRRLPTVFPARCHLGILLVVSVVRAHCSLHPHKFGYLLSQVTGVPKDSVLGQRCALRLTALPLRRIRGHCAPGKSTKLDLQARASKLSQLPQPGRVHRGDKELVYFRVCFLLLCCGARCVRLMRDLLLLDV